MTNFSKVAEEVFQILLSFDYTVDMFDGDNQRTVEPEDARRFFAKPHNILVSVIDDDDDSRINLFYGKSTHASDILGLDTSLRTAANKYALTFKAQQYGKEIEPKDIGNIVSSIVETQDIIMKNLIEKAPPGKKAEHFIKQHKAEFHKRYGDKGTEVLYATAWKKFGEGIEFDSPLVEGMYGTSKSSYLKMENAKMIVRHSKRIDDSQLGARSRCIENIFIENATGERHLFPSKALAPARAMTQHVSKGGNFQDQLGEQIIEMSEQYSNLRKMRGHVKKHGADLQEGAGAIGEACNTKMKNLRKTFECLSKEQTYESETLNVLERANMISEKNTIDETRLSEIRQLLNDADLPKSVYECAAKAMDECKEQEPMTEEVPTVNEGEKQTVRVLGQLVDSKAWSEFVKGKVLVSKIPDTSSVKFTNWLGELCYKLGEIADRAKDDSLANLFVFVKNKLENTDENPINNSSLKQNLLKIAKHAIKSVSASSSPELAENNFIVQEHMSWLEQFNTATVLSEADYWRNHPGSMDDEENFADEAEDYAIKNFIPEEFIESEAFQDDIGSHHSPDDPEENTITRDEIIGTLETFLRGFIESHVIGTGDAYNGDLSAIATILYSKVQDVLQSKGYIIDNGEGALAEDNGGLSMGNVIIPKPDMGASLSREVSMKTVDDPDHPGEKQKPDAEYVNRLSTLAGLRQGTNY